MTLAGFEARGAAAFEEMLRFLGVLDAPGDGGARDDGAGDGAGAPWPRRVPLAEAVRAAADATRAPARPQHVTSGQISDATRAEWRAFLSAVPALGAALARLDETLARAAPVVRGSTRKLTRAVLS